MPNPGYWNSVRSSSQQAFFATGAVGNTGALGSAPSPGAHYTASKSASQPPEYDFYASSLEPKPELAENGDRLLEYDKNRVWVYYSGGWNPEPNPLGDVISTLEGIKDEIAKATPTAEALLDKL